MFAFAFFRVVQGLLAEGAKDCAKMDVHMCRNVINETYNTPVTMERQKEINENVLKHFVPLIAVNCSCVTLLFVCLTHMPFCSNHIELPPLLPCRSVCEDVYFNCIRYYPALHLIWPQHLNCTNFPRHSTVCIQPPSSSAPSTRAPPTEPRTQHASSSFFITSNNTSPTTQVLPPSNQAPNVNFTDSSFILLAAYTVPKILFLLEIAFGLLTGVFVLSPFLILLWLLCWLRIRGKRRHEEFEEHKLSRLGPLPPVPEQRNCVLVCNGL